MKKINIALIGLGFGHKFAAIWAHHPNVDKLIVVESDKKRLNACLASKPGDNVVVYDSFEQVLADPTIDAVHVCTGIPAHAEMSIKVLEAGKHCACAVPMGVTLEELQSVVDATRKSGKNYMMLETNLYGSNYFLAKKMLDEGEFGTVQYMRGVHYQPMEYWPGYWMGLPPMHYATHCIAPLRGIAGSRIAKVRCHGAGVMDDKLTQQYGNPYPIEDALLEFENGMKAQVVRGLFGCSARPTEGFNIYGSKKTLMNEYEPHIVEKYYDESVYDFTSFKITPIKWKNHYEMVPKELWPYTLDPVERDNYMERLDTGILGEHLCSHPHLVHEFVMSVLEGRKAGVDEDLAANITAAGICAHISAMKDGGCVEIPVF